MKIFLNGEETDAKCLLYENGNQSIQIDRRNIVYITKYGTEIFQEQVCHTVNIIENGKNVEVQINDTEKYKLKNASRRLYD